LGWLGLKAQDPFSLLILLTPFSGNKRSMTRTLDDAGYMVDGMSLCQTKRITPDDYIVRFFVATYQVTSHKLDSKMREAAMMLLLLSQDYLNSYFLEKSLVINIIKYALVEKSISVFVKFYDYRYLMTL
jgi:hypothetical protein